MFGFSITELSVPELFCWLLTSRLNSTGLLDPSDEFRRTRL